MPTAATLPAPTYKRQNSGGRVRAAGYSRDAPILRRAGSSGSTVGDAKPQDAASINATSMRYLANRSWGTGAIGGNGEGHAR